MFANDVILCASIASLADAETLQHDIDAILLWCNKCRLFLNIFKCTSMIYKKKITGIFFSFSIDGTILASTEHY